MRDKDLLKLMQKNGWKVFAVNWNRFDFATLFSKKTAKSKRFQFTAKTSRTDC